MTPTATQSKPLPGPQGNWLLGSALDLRRDPLNFILSSFREYGDMVFFRFGGVRACFIAHPDQIRRVLLDNVKNYSKQTRGYESLREVLGNGLVTSEGEFWLRQRRIAQPSFHRGKIAGFATTMTQAAEAMLSRWEEPMQSGKPVDMASEMMRLTLEIVGHTILSVDVTGAAGKVGAANGVLLTQTNNRIARPIKFPRWVPTKENRDFKSALGTMHGLVMGFIDERRRSKADPGDLLSMLMNARDEETGEGMSDEQLRDEVLTMFSAGHETTANNLMWTWFLLSKFPEVFRKLRAELSAVLNGRTPTLEDLPKLVYTKRVLQESMRLYPPVPFVSRSPVVADQLGAYTVEPGVYIFMSPWVTHRHPAFWENPEGFDPDRWGTKAVEDLPRFAYYPFLGGPRQCIGNSFAQMEAELILATVAQRVHPALVPGHPVVPEAAVSLRAKYGMQMVLNTANLPR